MSLALNGLLFLNELLYWMQRKYFTGAYCLSNPIQVFGPGDQGRGMKLCSMSHNVTSLNFGQLKLEFDKPDRARSV
ncbi:MAG: hypothetical protein KQI35_16620 [Bacteroidetes bacterium]|nr:hypothetical protein [Bacteroidota bacterium]